MGLSQEEPLILSPIRRASSNYYICVENLGGNLLVFEAQENSHSSQLERPSLKYFLPKYFPFDTPVSTRLCD